MRDQTEFSNGRQRAFSRWVKKRRFYHRRARGLASMLDGNLEFKYRSGNGTLFVYSCESNIFFQDRRPRAGGGVPNLPLILIDGYSAAPGRQRKVGRQANLLKKIFVITETNFQTDYLAL